VARLDYHSDSRATKEKPELASYFDYMNWVRWHIKDIAITNYFVRWPEHDYVVGNLATLTHDHIKGSSNGLEDKSYRAANHFDIDVDCIDMRYCIQDIYAHSHGEHNVSPGTIVSMISESAPRKLGFWEYRPAHDSRKLGLQMIIDSVGTLSRQKEKQFACSTSQ
jgi:hypothetical protein